MERPCRFPAGRLGSDDNPNINRAKALVGLVLLSDDEKETDMKKKKTPAAPAAPSSQKPTPETTAAPTTQTTLGDPGPGVDPEFELLSYNDVLVILGHMVSKRTLSRWVSQAHESDGFELVGGRYFTRALLADLWEIRRYSNRHRGRPRTRGYLVPENDGGVE